MKYSRADAVNLINSWLGKNEADGSHREIIDIYNTQRPLPRGYKVKYTDAWCATTTSAVGVKLNYLSIIPSECSCHYLIKLAKEMNIWQESDSYVPSPADLILYDWDDKGIGDNTNAPDHVGMVVEVYKDAGYMVVTEGNYNDMVKKRTISLNGRYIRGFICPKYTADGKIKQDTTKKSNEVIAIEVILGKWGNGDERKARLRAAGYDPEAIRVIVNQKLNGSAVQPTSKTQNQGQPVERKVIATAKATKFNKNHAGTYVTTADIYIRNDAGQNKKAMAIIPKNTKVNCYGYYSIYNGTVWHYITVAIDGVMYVGFSTSMYLVRQ